MGTGGHGARTTLRGGMIVATLATGLLASFPVRGATDADRASELRATCDSLRRGREYDQAIDHCRRAVALHDVPANRASLAEALLERGHPKDLFLADDHARWAFEHDRSDPRIDIVYGRVVARLGDAYRIDLVVSHLGVVAPAAPERHAFRATAALLREQWWTAWNAIDDAEAAGLAPEEVVALRARLRAEVPTWLLAVVGVVAFGAGWLATFGVLFVGGFALSASAMHAARHLPRERSGRPGGFQKLIRRAYGALLWTACVFYYVTLPVLVLVILAILAALAYAALTKKIQAGAGLGVVALALLGSLWSMFQSFRARHDEVEPGSRLDLATHPRLQAALVEVAEALGTRPVDVVYLTPGTEMGVHEDVGALARLLGRSGRRSLVMGLGFISSLTLLELKTVLAHEYGHLENDDNAGGGFALAVRRSLLMNSIAMAQHGADRIYNPAWWFFRSFELVFFRISQGASRLREVLADRWAAFTYGADAFERGMRRSTAGSIAFDSKVECIVRELLSQPRGLVNIYVAEPMASFDPAALEATVQRELSQPASPFDSHPSPNDRIDLVRRLVGTPQPVDDGAPAISLLDDVESLQRMMTREICRDVALATGMMITETGVEPLHPHTHFGPGAALQ